MRTGFPEPLKMPSFPRDEVIISAVGTVFQRDNHFFFKSWGRRDTQIREFRVRRGCNVFL